MPRHKGVGRKVKRKRANESEVVGAEPDGAVEGGKSKCYCFAVTSCLSQMGVAPRSGRGVSICIICHHLCVIMRHSYATEFGTVMSAEGSPEGIHG